MGTKEQKSVTGYLGGDVSYKELDGGKKVANFQVSSGLQDGKPSFQSVTVWGELAEKAANLKKGEKVSVSGETEMKPGTGQYSDRQFSVLTAKVLDKHHLVELTGKISEIEFKTPKEKEIGVVTLLSKDGDKEISTNVAAFGKVKDQLKDLGVNKGDFVSLKMDAKETSFVNKEGVSTPKTEYTLISSDKIQVEQNKGAEKTVAKDAKVKEPKAPKVAKSQGLGL